MAYATRTREKAHECEFGDTNDERILEHLIQTIENQQIIQKCISKSWTLQQFLTEAGQIEDISSHHDMKADPAYRVIAKVMSRRRNQKSRHPEYDERDGRAEYRTYCGLTRAHPRGKHCPAYGTQCNICEKFNHFSFVCRANVTQEAVMVQKSPLYHYRKKKPSIKITEEVDYRSDTSSDEDFIEKSLMHMSIKAVSEFMEEKGKGSPREIKLLQGKISRLENELNLTKNLIQSLLANQQTEDHIDNTTDKHPETRWEKNEKIYVFSNNMQGPEERKARKCQLGYTKNSAARDLEECEEKEEHPHHTELRTTQEKKQRKKCRKKKIPKTL